MNEKPQTRVVSKRPYLHLMTIRTCLLLFALGFGWVGFDLVRQYAASLILETDPAIILILYTPVYVCLIAIMFFMASFLFKKERRVERVTLITKRTTSTLPPEDSLVRASDAPPAEQQTELLRAAQYGGETPPEELLRATSEQRQDV